MTNEENNKVKNLFEYAEAKPETKDELFIISIAVTEADLLKFNAKCKEIYTQIPQELILSKFITTGNIINQQGVIVIHNLYMEVVTDEAGFKAWQQDIKLKKGVIL